MAKGNVVLVVHASQGYMRCVDGTTDFSAQNDILFSAVSQTYLPLLSMLDTLEAEGIPVRISLVLPAALCTLLDDPRVQKQYVDNLDRRIALGEAECLRLAQSPLLPVAESCLAKARKDRSDFCVTYGQNLVGAFRAWAKKGVIELIPTAATGAYLPHYADMTEVLNAQVETGLYAQRHFFGDTGEGFFLPYEGYAPGIENVLRSYGINYTVLDARALLFSKSRTDTGIFAPVRTRNSLVLFGSDPRCVRAISGEDGFASHPAYRAQHADIGFDLDASLLSAFSEQGAHRVQTLYKYWANGTDGPHRAAYDAEEAHAQAARDAASFSGHAEDLLSKAAAFLPGGESPLIVCAIPAELLGQEWGEGIDWLSQVIRNVARSDAMRLSHCRDLIGNQFSLPKIEPYPCSSNGTGYGEDLLDSSNCWMMRYVRKASERMVDLAERFPSETGLKARLLNIAAREVLLAQSGEWPRMISCGILPDAVGEQFKNHILSFTTVFDSLASNTVSTEWLTRIEKEHAIFPWMNYRIFSRKK